MDTELTPLSETTFLKSLTSISTNLWLSGGFIQLNSVEPSLGISSSGSLINPLSTYYFLLAAAPKDASYKNSRSFTGSDSLFLSGNKLSYNNNNPKYDFDISGDFHALSANIETLSTNYFDGKTLHFNDFELLEFNPSNPIIGNKNFYFKELNGYYLFVESITSLSSRYDFIIGDSTNQIFINNLFSSINWNLSSAGLLSTYNVKIKENLITSFVSAKNVYIKNLNVDDFTIKNNLSSLSNLYCENAYGSIEIDPESSLCYQGDTLSTKLSTVYFFGVKPSDSHASDNISIVRTFDGAWDSAGIKETLPVLKPYFKNVRQVFDYVKKQGLYGQELNILIYEDVLQTNSNTDDSYSVTNHGSTYSGNIVAQYWSEEFLPVALKNKGLKSGEYVWNTDPLANINGYINYWGAIGDLGFSDLNIAGMYEIGSKINIGGTKEYTLKKPFDYPPRKISFRTYVCNNPNLVAGQFGNDPDVWTTLSTKPKNLISLRPFSFLGDDMDINIQNICFEFEGNVNDSTCIYCRKGDIYLSNVTVAALGSANYPYGALILWPQSNVYVCGENQIDPYLLSPTTWNNWTSLPTAENQAYYPGYGLAIVGNPVSQPIPTLFNNNFIHTWQANLHFMDYAVNRRIGRNSYLNASIILDGRFNAKSFYTMRDCSKVFATNYTFRTNTFSLSNLNANIFSLTPYNGQYINVYQNTNRNNFYYLSFNNENFSKFTPNYFDILNWEFNDANDPVRSSVNDKNIFTAKFSTYNDLNYIFEPSTNSINLSGSVIGKFYKNDLDETSHLSDNFRLYNYISPNDLPLYDTLGLYKLESPINSNFSYILNYYSYD